MDIIKPNVEVRWDVPTVVMSNMRLQVVPKQQTVCFAMNNTWPLIGKNERNVKDKKQKKPWHSKIYNILNQTKISESTECIYFIKKTRLPNCKNCKQITVPINYCGREKSKITIHNNSHHTPERHKDPNGKNLPHPQW